MKPADLAIYLFLSITWGLSFLVVVKNVDAFGWAGAVAFRALVAGATLVLIAAATRRTMAFGPRLAPFLVVGATTVAGQMLGLALAGPLIGTAMTAILFATVPVFSMLVGQAWGVERMTPQRVAGVGLGIAGIVALVGFPAVPFTLAFALGCAAALAGSAAAGFGNVYAARTMRGAIGPFEVSAASFLAGGLMMLPVVAVVPVARIPTATDIALLIVAGSLMSALNYVNYFRLVASIGATRAISVEFVVTTVAVLVGAILLDEPVTLLQLAGGAVVLAGCGLVLGLVPGRRRGPDEPDGR
jgi:drug/metabolite transporter (DMT)-like permease